MRFVGALITAKMSSARTCRGEALAASAALYDAAALDIACTYRSWNAAA
jgi:hypothetical protein